MPRQANWKNLIPGVIALLVLVGSALAVLLFARVGALRGDKIELWVTANQARGVMKATPVWLAGQKVGLVEDIEFLPVAADSADRVAIRLEVLRKYREHFRSDSRGQIRSGGSLLGAPVIYFTPGTSDGTVLAAGDTIRHVKQGDPEGLSSQVAVATRQFPPIIENVKMLNQQLVTARGTVGALLYSEEGLARFEVVVDQLTNVTRRATSGTGSLGLAFDRKDLTARARHAMAQADSIQLLLKNPDPRSTLGRFRRDSSLLVAVQDTRNEIAIVRALLAEPRGTAGRILGDSAVFQEVSRFERELDALFADLRKNPFRYIAF